MKTFYYPPTKEIVYLKSDKNYTEFHLIDGKKVVSSLTLLRHQEQLNGFLRVNKSYLLNPTYIDSIDSNGGFNAIRLKGGKLIRVSRRRKSVLENIG